MVQTRSSFQNGIVTRSKCINKTFFQDILRNSKEKKRNVDFTEKRKVEVRIKPEPQESPLLRTKPEPKEILIKLEPWTEVKQKPVSVSLEPLKCEEPLKCVEPFKCKEPLQCEEPFSFEDAHNHWISNKKLLANGHYAYLCGKVLSNGKKCKKICCDKLGLYGGCQLHFRWDDTFVV
jgi:hypothetical protein